MFPHVELLDEKEIKLWWPKYSVCSHSLARFVVPPEESKL